MDRRTVSTSVSSDVVEYLLQRGMTPADIAEILGVTKSFVSRVKSRQRSLTLDHLAALERVMGKPLPLLLIEATPKEDIPRNLLALYEATKSVLRSSMRLRRALAVRPSARRPKSSAVSHKRAG